jgi:NAD(P)-dependent dehydrogenase (short-subunit alcohol dehydrogenase family)
MNSLEGKVVLVTGAKGGLGTCVTNALLSAGATVAGVSRSIKDSDFPHAGFAGIPAELSSSEAARSIASAVAAKFGRLDVLVHLVGGFAGGVPVVDTDDSTLEQMLDLNLRSAFYIIKAVLPYMCEQRKGSLIAVGSRAAVDGNAGAGAYSASKAALIAMMRAVAAENSDRCISANVVLPGTMNTSANRVANPNADTSKWVKPAQVANLIVGLASDDLTQVNGAAIPIYGREV